MAGRSPIGRIAYRDHPAEGTYPVRAAWKRLKRWSTANLPQHTGRDNPPASKDEIEAFETAIGAKLPKDVRASYAVYNGQCAGTGIVYGLAVDPLRDCLNNWHHLVAGYDSNLQDGSAADLDSGCSEFPNGFVRPVYYDRGWIPLTYDSGGNHIGVDLNPGPKGTRGQVIVFGRDDEFHPVLALSWGQFLTDLADELGAGNFHLGKTDPDYPEFTLDAPRRPHFHSVGIYWSRGKLGLRRLAKPDERRWRTRTGSGG